MHTGAVDPGLYGTEAGFEAIGDFFVGEALLLEHQDGAALVVGEGGERSVEGFFDLAGTVAGFRLLLHDEISRVDEIKRAASTFTVAVDQSAAGEGEYKCVERAARLIARRGAIQLNKCFLGEIFGVATVTCGAVKEINQPRLPAFDNTRKGNAITFRNRA